MVFLGTTEVALRIAGVRPAYRVEDLGQWRMSGGLSNRATSGPRDGHTFSVSTNADGLRTALTRSHEGGKKRVAIMGDSTVFGWGVDDGQTVADGVQQGLGDAYEVLNAGQPGYSTTMMAWLFDEVLKDYTPDVTLVMVPMHDTNLVLVSDREVLDGGATLSAKVRVTLARDSRIYEMLRGVLFQSTEKAWLLPNETGREPRVPRVSDAERTADVEAIRATVQAWGGSVMVGFLPFKGDIEEGRMNRPARAWAESYTTSSGVPFIDVSACCYGQTGLVLTDDPGHLTGTGNLLAGNAIAAKMKAVGL